MLFILKISGYMNKIFYEVKKPSGWFMKEFPQLVDKTKLYPFLMLIHNTQIFFTSNLCPHIQRTLYGTLVGVSDLHVRALYLTSFPSVLP
jgi:hypothetical protein